MQKSETEPAAPTRRKRNRGWFKKGNVASLITGMRSELNQLPDGLDHLVAETEAFIAGSLVDEGDDAADIPTRRKAQLEYRARLHRRILQLDSALELRGLIDKRGKLRVAWLSKLESLISAAVRIDNLLGLVRRARRTQTPIEWLESLGDNNNNEQEGPNDEGPDAHNGQTEQTGETAQIDPTE